MVDVPKGAKKPQDHKPKAEDAGTGQVVEVRGLQVTISAEALDDFELLDDLAQVEQKNAVRMPSLLRRLVGHEQWRDVIDLARDESTGRVSVEAGAELIREIFEELKAPNS